MDGKTIDAAQAGIYWFTEVSKMLIDNGDLKNAAFLLAQMDEIKTALGITSPQKLELNAEEIQLIKSGNKIEAIKCVKARLGIALKDAKDLVVAYVDANPGLFAGPNVPMGYKVAGFNPQQLQVGVQVPTTYHSLTPVEIEMLTHGQKIQDIKSIRERLNIGLKEAINKVNQFISSNPQCGLSTIGSYGT